MTNPDNATTTGPYARAVASYWRAGWRGLLPLPYGKKTPVPTGYTGTTGTDPSYPDVQTWADGPEGAGNIALRLPPDVIGVDVDNYGGKPARLVLDELERQHGALPATWRSTSRDDGTSGIRLYKVPPGLRWPGGLGPGIDLLRHGHRYALIWPSIHPEGGTYRWINPDGATTLDQIPDADTLPHLPDAWIAHFTGGELETEQPRANLDDTAAATWLNHHGQGHPCSRLDRAFNDAIDTLPAATSRHDHILHATNRIIWLAAESHPGAVTVLDQLRDAFLTSTSGDRGPGEAEAEWSRMIAGAVRLAAARDLEPGVDPCNPESLLPPGATPCPIPSETSPASPTPSSSSSSSSNASPSTADQTGPNATPDRERSTWWPVDLEHALRGEPEPPPVHLTRSDNHAALYAGRVNGIIGPSESGKTWVALHSVQQAIEVGLNVTFLDFEDTDKGVVRRLMNLGVPPEAIRTHLAYIGPSERYAAFTPSGIDLADHLAQHQPSLIVLDGFNASMSLQGLNLLDNMDATLYFQTLLKPLSAIGATVLYIDHTPKNNGENSSAGGIGAQAKRAMTTGCTLKVEVIKHFARGKAGKLRIWVDKDRQGDVRAVSASGKTDDWFGDFDVTGHDDSTLDVALNAPEGLDAANPEDYTFRPTGYMERVSAWLEQNPGSGMNEIKAGVGGRTNHVASAVRVLVSEGWVEVSTGARNKQLHTVTTPFSEASDLAATATGTTESPPSPHRDRDPVKTTGTTESHRVTKDPVGSGTGQSTNRDSLRPPTKPNIVERSIAGERVMFNLDTGVVVDP